MGWAGAALPVTRNERVYKGDSLLPPRRGRFAPPSDHTFACALSRFVDFLLAPVLLQPAGHRVASQVFGPEIQRDEFADSRLEALAVDESEHGGDPRHLVAC